MHVKPDLRPVDGDGLNEELASLAKAIAHPARMRIIRFLEKRTSCTCAEIVNVLPLAQSTISQHLAVLKKAGLVGTTRAGEYALDPGRIRRLRMLVAAL